VEHHYNGEIMLEARQEKGIIITGVTGTVDATVSNPSAVSYNEASTNGGTNINAKWEAIDGNTTLVNGKGYRVYVRRNRTSTNLNTTKYCYYNFSKRNISFNSG
jgi:hypothetical protein